MAASLPHRWITHPEDIDLLNYIIKRTKNIESPANIEQLLRDFKEKSGAAKSLSYLNNRICVVRTRIHSFELIDTKTKVKMLFALSAAVDADFLKELQKNAFVEVDEKNRITHYKAINGSLELRRDHSLSAKDRTAKLVSKQSIRSWIIDYFENKKNVNAVPEEKKEKEMENLIDFITEKCEQVNTPLNVQQLARDFINHFGISRSADTIRTRVKVYCNEIQGIESLDALTKIKQLFCLSATLDSDFLNELRKNAAVNVDDLNRITKYTANDGSLTLKGDHSYSAKAKLGWIEFVKKRNAAKKYRNFGDDDDDKSDEEIDHSEEDSDEYSSEEVDSDDDNHRMNESEDLVEPLKKTYDPKEKKDDGWNRKNNKNPKRKNISPTAPSSENKRNKSTSGCSASNWTGQFSNNSMRPNELDDYDMNYSIDDEVKLEPFRGSIQENLNEFKEDEDIQQIPKPLKALDEHYRIEEVPIKVESEELKMVENPTENVKTEIAQAHDELKELIKIPIKVEHEEPVEVKPEASYNPKIRFIEAMHSLIICLDIPSLSWIQSKINQKIQNLGRSDEVILNSETALTIDLLISRMTNYSVVNLSRNAESVSFSNLLCYLKASILNSKMSGADGLVKNINGLIEESQNKRIPMENVANALRATLDIDGF